MRELVTKKKRVVRRPFLILQVTKTTFSGLQDQRIIVYTATGQKAKPKVHMSTGTRNSSKTPEACRRETEKHKLKTAA
jgi:hypothetical protein